MGMFSILFVLVLTVTTSLAQLCYEVVPGLDLPCKCNVDENKAIKINCDYVAFGEEFPLLPYKMNIVEYRQRDAGLLDLTSQMFKASQLPVRKVDFSRNDIRELLGRVFDGLENTLETLLLDHNRLGDVYTQKLALPEISKLKALKTLNLGFNEIQGFMPSIFTEISSLQVLQLEGNLLPRVPTEEMKGLNNLKILTLQENDFDELSIDGFHTTPELAFLNISHNKISIIQNGAFRGLVNLTALDLSYNRMKELKTDAFKGLSNLETLDLSSNFFNEVPAESLNHLSSLKNLIFKDNQIVTLGGIVALSPTSTLKNLDLTRNHIVNLESRTFKRLSNLETLKISVNSVGKRNDDAFDGLNSLKTLELDDLKFFSFPTAMLSRIPNLKSLSLNFNRIRVITASSLRTGTNLEELSIADNIIQKIPENTFNKLKQLKVLNLFGNKITELQQNVFSTLKNTLIDLNLGSNALSAIPKFDMPLITKLSLSGNMITSLEDDAFFFMPKLQLLDLSKNQLASISSNLFNPLSTLGNLDLGYNKLTTIESGQFNGTAISFINLSHNKLRNIQSKAFQNLLFLTSMDLSNNEIENIEDGAFYDTTFLHILNLQANKLTSFKKTFFSYPRRTTTLLRYLDVSDNDITFLADDTFASHPRIIVLNLAGNRLSFFPKEILGSTRELSLLNLKDNSIETVRDFDFSGSRSLRELDISNNKVKEIEPKAFQNSSQLQELNLGNNMLSELHEDTFKGLSRITLDLSNNDLSSFPSTIFHRSNMKLLSLDVSHNSFTEIPVDALRSQYYFFSSLNMAHNKVSGLPSNADVLVNMKSLDLSFNPLTPHDIMELLNEPKMIRYLNIAGTGINHVPLLEARFLISLNLSNNGIDEVSDQVFKLTHNLRKLDISNNQIANVEHGLSSAWPEMPNLRYLDISHNPIQYIDHGDFSGLKRLEVLKAHNLRKIEKIEAGAFDGIPLQELELYGLSKVNNLDVKEILNNLPGLEKVDIEVKQKEVDEDLSGAFSPRLQKLNIRGKMLQKLKSSAFLNLNSPGLDLGILDTNISSLDERMLFLVPMSSEINLMVNNSGLETLSNRFLEDVLMPREGRLSLTGLDTNPLYCDCNLKSLQEWIISDPNSSLQSAVCSGPQLLKGKKIVDLKSSQLVCSERVPEVTTRSNDRSNIITKDEIDYNTSSKRNEGYEEEPQTKFTSMDKIIIGVVGGVIGFVALLIIIVCLVRVVCDPKREPRPHYHGNVPCTCVKPPMPSMGYVGPYVMPGPGSRAGTLKSMPPSTPIPPAYGTLGAQSRNSYYSGPPSYMGMYHHDEHDYR